MLKSPKDNRNKQMTKRERNKHLPFPHNNKTILPLSKIMPDILAWKKKGWLSPMPRLDFPLQLRNRKWWQSKDCLCGQSKQRKKLPPTIMEDSISEKNRHNFLRIAPRVITPVAFGKRTVQQTEIGNEENDGGQDFRRGCEQQGAIGWIQSASCERLNALHKRVTT